VRCLGQYFPRFVSHPFREPSVVAPAALPAADARFMIVACSAFVNWLILKADEAKLLRTRTACPSTPYLALARL